MLTVFSGCSKNLDLKFSQKTINVGENIALFEISEEADEFISDNENVLRIYQGKVYGVSAGSANITVKKGDRTAVCEITVNASEDDYFELINFYDTGRLELGIGAKEKLNFLFSKNFQSIDFPIEFVSSNPSVAKIENGEVIALLEGVALINASVNINNETFSSEVILSVYNEYSVTTDKDYYVLSDGYDTAYIDTLSFFKGDEEIDFSDLKWISQNPDVVKSDEDGKLTAFNTGVTEIHAYYNDILVKKVKAEVCNEISGYALDNPSNVIWQGRCRMDNNGRMLFANSASGFEFNFVGVSAVAKIYSQSNSIIKVYVDGIEKGNINTTAGAKEYILADGLTNEPHRIKVVRLSEQIFASYGRNMGLDYINIEGTDGKYLDITKEDKLLIEFYGDSITCGYGVLGQSSTEDFKLETQDATLTYAYLLSEKLNANYSTICYSGISAVYKTNLQEYLMGDIYNRYSAADKTEWDFSASPADIIVVNLGTNDSIAFSSSVGNEADFYEGYLELIKKFRAASPNAAIICTYGAMGINQSVENGILQAVETLNNEGDDSVYYMSFIPNNSGSAGHPNAAAHKIMAADLYEFIKINDIC